MFKILEENPKFGIPLGNNCFKIRLAISSKGKGKSGGGRLITHFVISENIIYLLSIFDKSDKENLTDKEISELLAEIE